MILNYMEHANPLNFLKDIMVLIGISLKYILKWIILKNKNLNKKKNYININKMTIQNIEIKNSILENRPNLTQSSVRTYLSNINKTAKDLDIEIKTPEDIIKHNEEILDYLMSYKPSIRKTKLSAFIVVIDKKDKNSEEVNDIIERFRRQLFDDADEVEKNENKQTLTKRQEENYIPWNEVLNIYEDLKTETEPLFKLKALDKKQFTKLQNFVLLSCYVLIPPRRSQDYADFKIRNIDDKKDNYMVVKGRKKKGSFIFNSYKNSKRLGQQVVEIPNALRNIITKWINVNPCDYLIVANNCNKVEQPKINLILNSIFGKNIGSSLLRHIYLTDKYADVNLEELKETTENMGNSLIERTLKYVKKNIDDDE